MRRFGIRLAALVLLLPTLAESAGPSRTVLVVCAPGYPGSTEEAQPLLDDFTRAAALKADWPPEALQSVYYQNEADGLERLARPDAGMALVPLPFLLKHERALDLSARLHAIPEVGGDQAWSLVARKGALARPADLAGWELTGRPGYSPAFVRGPILGDWGRPPDDTAVTFTKSPLSALRRAAAGEKIAVILDREQTEALDSLPFGAELEIVTRTGPMPGMILATVGKRLDEASAGRLMDALLRLHQSKKDAEILGAILMSRFDTVDAGAIEKARAAFEGR